MCFQGTNPGVSFISEYDPDNKMISVWKSIMEIMLEEKWEK